MPKKILIADDDRNYLVMLESLLKARGYAVYTAKNGEEALEKARAVVPDLIVLDVRMPVMEGDEAAMHLKGDEATKHIPILILTGLRTEKEIAENHEENIFAKPVQIQQFLDKIKSFIGE